MEINTNENVVMNETDELAVQTDNNSADRENNANETSVEETNSALGMGAGIALVAGAAAAYLAGKKLRSKWKDRKAAKSEEAEYKPVECTERKLTLKERLTGKIKVETETVETVIEEETV